MHFGETSNVGNQVRTLLRPSPVERGKYPKWVLEGIKKAVRDGKIAKFGVPLLSASVAIEKATRLLGHSWLDHGGRLKWDGIEFVVSEPYAAEVSLQMLTELNKFVELLGTGYLFSANSEHFPSRTIRIVIGPTQADTSEYRKHEYVSAMQVFGR